MNKKSIVESLVHTVDQTAEIKAKDGKTIGKVKLFWVKNKATKKPALVANGFEISAGYQQNKQVRDAAAEFMKGYAKAVTGSDNVPMYMGKSFNDVPINGLKQKNLDIELIGNVSDNKYYFDSIQPASWSEDLHMPKKVEFLVLTFSPKTGPNKRW